MRSAPALSPTREATRLPATLANGSISSPAFRSESGPRAMTLPGFIRSPPSIPALNWRSRATRAAPRMESAFSVKYSPVE